MYTEKKLLRLKFVNQGGLPYEKEVPKLSDLNEKELEEVLEIIIRLKKARFYSKCMLEEVIPHISNSEMKLKVEEFIQIRK